ncbi:MAG: ABC transporter ATP-binding protein [Anaerolineae bacterium]|nr:ABC transporter ATP-binding protein [Anaerolineae bacterium]NUQ03949.1 ABC transporter ATP-binding protein [Anaerolineae bacterium]
MPALEIAGAVKRYGDLVAVDHLDLKVEQGEIFGLLGANGAGKTTLIKLLIGLLQPDSGQIRTLGLDPVREARALRQQVGYMPQSPVLYDDLTARENLIFWTRAHRLPDLRRQVDETLALVSLSARADDPVHTFSGGMKQRLSLACALAHRPRLLLLDEPTTGVDPKLRQTFWETFRAMTAAGATILISTHQMDEAAACDRLAIMREGAVLACDSPAGLFAGARAHVEIETTTGSAQYHLTDYAHALPELLRAHPLSADVRRITVEREPLESIVLRLIDSRS